VRRHIESNNLLFFIAFLEFYCAIALIAINNKQPIYSNKIRIEVKIFKLSKR
jgi:hypothetical protein